MRTIVLVKKEATYGTNSSPVAGMDGVACYDPIVNYTESVTERNLVTGTLSQSKPIRNRGYGNVSFNAELKGSGTAGTAPEWGDALQACGYSETISSGTSVTYEPVSSGQSSVTIEVYQDGLVHKLTGCRGNAKFMVGVEGVSLVEFSFMGLKADPNPTAASFPTGVALDTTTPVASKEGTFSFGGETYNIASWEVDTGNNVVMTDSLNASVGYGEATITARNPVGSFDPEQEITNNIQALVAANAEHALAWANGGAAGNRVAVNLPKATLMDASSGDRDGYLTYAAGFKPAMDDGDDEIQVVLT